MSSTRSQRTVLFVDDDQLLLAAYKRGLELKTGARALVASCLAEARALSRAHCPDACVVDYHLSRGESGLDLLGELRRRHANAVLVLVTAYGHLELGAAAIKAGADHVCAKPVALSEILKRIAGAPPAMPAPIEPTASDERARWEHMHRVLRDCDGNRSEAARRLRIDRGTLQRWLERCAPHED